MTLSLIVLLIAALLVALGSWATAWHIVGSDTFADRGRTPSFQDRAPRDLVSADAR